MDKSKPDWDETTKIADEITRRALLVEKRRELERMILEEQEKGRNQQETNRQAQRRHPQEDGERENRGQGKKNKR